MDKINYFVIRTSYRLVFSISLAAEQWVDALQTRHAPRFLMTLGTRNGSNTQKNDMMSEEEQQRLKSKRSEERFDASTTFGIIFVLESGFLLPGHWNGGACIRSTPRCARGKPIKSGSEGI